MNNSYNSAPAEIPNPFIILHQEIKEIKDFLFANKSIGQHDDEILNLKEAAVYLNLSENSLYRLMKLDQLPNYKRAGKVMFSKNELNAWIKEGRRNTINQTDLKP